MKIVKFEYNKLLTACCCLRNDIEIIQEIGAIYFNKYSDKGLAIIVLEFMLSLKLHILIQLFAGNERNSVWYSCLL